ncbi:hypothetical protein E2C01_065109 [Portunus trituberculatus]|uniref:Uncharacterized protein n=1 Tax=Portunus trituberculatus TaxID=210409 RepID=A0A5B7HQ72_PORTR|nr:hypothetical protein [Portunus trituberculatus]
MKANRSSMKVLKACMGDSGAHQPPINPVNHPNTYPVNPPVHQSASPPTHLVHEGLPGQVGHTLQLVVDEELRQHEQEAKRVHSIHQ